mmetsp:Transcript_72228/g.120909  ORF Transcript_72228/g.120909 Transcript_72228/m.120909 type:complete len:124 (-) Transcript_72228:84-455(-)
MSQFGDPLPPCALGECSPLHGDAAFSLKLVINAMSWCIPAAPQQWVSVGGFAGPQPRGPAKRLVGALEPDLLQWIEVKGLRGSDDEVPLSSSTLYACAHFTSNFSASCFDAALTHAHPPVCHD